MLPLQIANQTVLRLRATTSTDSHTDSYLDWDTISSTISIGNCAVQPLQGDESILGRDSVTSRWNLWAPPDADIASTDRIRHDGVDYEVDGSVQKWTDTTGNGWDHLFAIIKRVEG